jgi:hypothetical protein
MFHAFFPRKVISEFDRDTLLGIWPDRLLFSIAMATVEFPYRYLLHDNSRY